MTASRPTSDTQTTRVRRRGLETASNTKVDFDKDFVVQRRHVGARVTRRPLDAALDHAMRPRPPASGPRSVSGTANLCSAAWAAARSVVPAVVTAFNGAQSGGNPDASAAQPQPERRWLRPSVGSDRHAGQLADIGGLYGKQPQRHVPDTAATGLHRDHTSTSSTEQLKTARARRPAYRSKKKAKKAQVLRQREVLDKVWHFQARSTTYTGRRRRRRRDDVRRSPARRRRRRRRSRKLFFWSEVPREAAFGPPLSFVPDPTAGRRPGARIARS